MKRDDIVAGFIIGEASAWLILAIFQNIRVELPFLWALPVLLPIISLLGLLVADFLGRKFLILWQAAKFALVGVLNTLIDLGVLNILSMLTGITKGFIVGGVNVPGFSVAVVNSYFWNKLWVFQRREKLFLDFPQFLAVSVIGILLNSGIIIVLTTYVNPFFGASEELWLNIAKLVAVPANMMWNFLGYKFIVFKR